MNGRERVKTALDHRQPDRVPLDLGASPTTGIHASAVYLLRQALQLDSPGTPVKVIEPYQLLGEVKPDLLDKLGVDVVGVSGSRTMFGFPNENWKPWTTFDGTPVLVPDSFNTDPEPNGDILMYPEGDKTAPPSGRMPKGGFYFDAIIRQEPIDDNKLDPEDNLEEFAEIGEDELAYFAREIETTHTRTEKAILANFGGTAFGDIALVPAVQLKNPKGIRDIAEWYMSTILRRNYVWEVFERQCAIALNNLEKIYEVVGDKVDVVFLTGTDFGAQNGSFISPKAYRDLYQPFHKAINDWVHTRTGWKTFIHSCGSVYRLIPDFIESGFDILNPVQTSAAEMAPEVLKNEFGADIVFWGGGVDTQDTLPFGTPQQIRNQVRERMRVFGKGGGFVFNTIHNIQAGVPQENLVALFDAIDEYR
jgi:hypothetical protein